MHIPTEILFRIVMAWRTTVSEPHASATLSLAHHCSQHPQIVTEDEAAMVTASMLHQLGASEQEQIIGGFASRVLFRLNRMN